MPVEVNGHRGAFMIMSMEKSLSENQ
jgi:hypothetical protein